MPPLASPRLNSTIFTFREPPAAIVPYVALCMKTWERPFAGHRVVVLDHAHPCLLSRTLRHLLAS